MRPQLARRKHRWLNNLALIGFSGIACSIISGCNPEVVNIWVDAFEGAAQVGLPTFFEWLRQPTEGEDVDSVPTVLREAMQIIRLYA